MPKLDKYISLIVGLLFLAFCIPKLTASDVSLQLFAQINHYTHFQGRWFMYLTGCLELAVGSLVFFSALFVKSRDEWRSVYGLYLLGLVGTLGTMSGAMFVEFFIRPGEDPALSTLAPLIFLTAAFLLWRNLPYIPFLNKGITKQNA